ncbi:MAG: mandelate racemase/muconate lactonizing enzyme family protein [Sphaerochaeta sp.]|nr:mandelate racemase/muconate lactonizing enzyme family protein [Sphaerochaeta sp.]
MKISNVRVYTINLPTDTWMLVTIETSNGIVGWGEITDSFNDTSLAEIIVEARQALIGKNPLHIQDCLKDFYTWVYPVKNSIRLYRTALSGLDQALWDISAKFHNLPLYALYGGDGTSSIPLYANLNKAIRNNRSAQALKDSGELAYKAGFKMVKCTPFDEITPRSTYNILDRGFERFAALAEALPIGAISIDCHQRFERHTLSQMVERVLTEYGNPYWIEDPVDILDYKTMEIMNSRFPEVLWAAGEDSINERQLHTTIASGTYGVLMPDVKYIGGPSVVKSIIPYAQALGFRVTLHNPNGIIATAHSAHLSALCQNDFPMEFPFQAVMQREILATPQEMIKDGRYVFTDAPGIGIEITKEALKEYGTEFHHGAWKAIQ